MTGSTEDLRRVVASGPELARRSSFSGLRVRLMLLLLIAVVTPLAGIAYTTMEWRRHEVADAYAHGLNLVRHAGALHERLVGKSRDDLLGLSELPGLLEGADIATTKFALLAFLREHAHHTLDVGIIDRDGTVVLNAKPGGLHTVANRSFFQRAVETHRFAMGDYEIDPIVGKATVAFAHPIVDGKGQVRRVLYTVRHLAWVSELIGESTLPDGTTVTVFDEHGTVLAHEPTPSKRVGRSAAQDAFVRRILSEKHEGTGESTSADGVARLVAFRPLSGAAGSRDIYVSIGFPKRSITAEADRILARNLIGLGLAAVVAIGLAWVGSNLLFLRRVTALVDATTRLRSGDMSARTGLHDGPAELDQLASAFDAMAATLEQRDHEVRHQHDELSKQERRFRALIEHSSDGIVLLDNQAIVRYASPSTKRILGYAIEQLVGRSAFEFAHPDDRAELERRFKDVLREPRGFITASFRLGHKDGSWRWIGCVATNLLHEPAVAAVIANYRDITDRRAAEEALRKGEAWYRTLFESSRDGIIFVDTAGRIQQVNAAFARMVGYTAAELQAMTSDAITPAYWHEAKQAVNELVLARGYSDEHEFEYIRKDGSIVPVSTCVWLIRDDDGQAAGMWGIVRDITDHKQVERVLRESQEELNRAQAVAHTGSWRLDVRRGDLRWSDETYRMFGIPLGTPMTYDTFFAAIHPDDREEVYKHWTAAMEGTPYDIEHRIVVGETIKWVREKAELEFDADGTFVSAFGTVQDITERKRSEAALRAAHDELEIRVEARTAALKSTNQMLYTEVAVRKRAEQALSESRAMLADILGSAMDAIISIDANHRIILFNTAAEATFGCSAAEAVGQPIETFIPERLQGKNQDHVAAFSEAVTGGPPTGRRSSMIGVRANGEEFPIEAAISYSDAGGEAVSTIILRDVSERQRAEERLRKLSRAIEQTADSVMVANRDGIIEYVNRAFEELTGYSREEAIGARPTFVKAGRHDVGFYGALWKTILSGQSFRSIFTNTSKDGRIYHEDQTITPIRDANGEITHFVSTGRDITQRKRTEEALRRLNDALEREATRIASVLHDEAGQFLTAAHITLADVARQLPEPARESLQEVRRDLNQIEHQLRRLSHELHPRILDDLGLIDAVKFLADGVQRRTGVAISVEGTLEERCSPLVETAIYRLVQEALTNMTKHAGATRARILLQRDASTIRCSIRDDGVGFEVADVLDRRRDPGLGLIGIQDRLEVVGGTLEIISTPGGGTELRATIPLTT